MDRVRSQVDLTGEDGNFQGWIVEISIYEKVYGTEGQPQVDTTGEESERLDSEIR